MITKLQTVYTDYSNIGEITWENYYRGIFDPFFILDKFMHWLKSKVLV